MRKILSLATLSVAAFPAMASPATLPPSTASAYGTGQAYVRFFQDVLSPGICGIVLERERCNADFRAAQQWRGSEPNDSSYARWLTDGDTALFTKGWNGAYISENGWAQNPAFAWGYTAGAVSIAAEQPRNDATSAYLAHYVTDLANHSSAAPEGFAGLVTSSSSGSPFERAQPLQRVLAQAVPVVPYPLPAFGAGLTADARLGAYIATLQELVDNPLALSRPESRAFATIVLAHLQQQHQKLHDGLSVAGLQALVDGDIPWDPAQLDALWREPLSSQILNSKWPEDERKALLLGMLTAQVAYNAAVLKDAGFDATYRGVIAQLSSWPAMPKSMRADATALKAIPFASRGGSWKDINEAATRATLDLTVSP